MRKDLNIDTMNQDMKIGIVFFVLEDVGESSINDSNWKGFVQQPASFHTYGCQRFVLIVNNFLPFLELNNFVLLD